MRRVGKRGFWMAEESSKFILGIIAVVLLVILLVKLGGLVSDKNRYEQAKYTLSEISRLASVVNKDGTPKEFLTEGPKDWYLVDYYGRYPDVPKTCGLSMSCLCVCKGEGAVDDERLINFFFTTEGISGCESMGACESFKEEIVIDNKMMLARPAGPENYVEENRDLRVIKINNVPMTLTISKENEKIIVRRKT